MTADAEDIIRVLLVDDHALLRSGLKLLLEAQPDIRVIGEASRGDEAVERVSETCPDVILMDLSMSGMNGLQAIALIKQQFPQCRILVLTMHDDEEYLRQSLAAGASGYILKQAADSELLSALRSVHRGEVFLPPALTKTLVESLARPAERFAENHGDALSPRETEVARLVAMGHTNREIAELLVLSVKTVETHKARIMDKLGLRSRSELVRYAISKGLITTKRLPER